MSRGGRSVLASLYVWYVLCVLLTSYGLFSLAWVRPDEDFGAKTLDVPLRSCVVRLRSVSVVEEMGVPK